MPVRYRKLFWLGMLFTVVTSTGFALVSVRPGIGTELAMESKDAGSPATPMFAAQNSNNERLEAELITLHPSGFEPSEISRPAGPFILALQNRSGLEQLLLQINRSSGARMREVQMRRERSDLERRR